MGTFFAKKKQQKRQTEERGINILTLKVYNGDIDLSGIIKTMQNNYRVSL